VHNTGIHQAADTYVDQLQSCRPEILYPQLVHDAPKTEILKNILAHCHAQLAISSLVTGSTSVAEMVTVLGWRAELPGFESWFGNLSRVGYVIGLISWADFGLKVPLNTNQYSLQTGSSATSTQYSLRPSKDGWPG